MSARPMKPLAVALLASVTLSACADIYYDRRDAVHLSFGDANASNIAVQTIDPWPRHAANREIFMNGEVAQKAIQRYKEGKVTPPKGLGTSSIQIEANPAAPNPQP
jgi:hypothetical protein